METIGKIRRALAAGQSLRATAQKYGVSRNTVRRIVRENIVESKYVRHQAKESILNDFTDSLKTKLEEDSRLKKQERRKAIILFEELQREGYKGGYDTVRRYVRRWKHASMASHSAYVPLVFGKGEAFQFDWSEDTVELNGVVSKLQIAHLRLCYSRHSFIMAFPRQSEEMVLEAHIRAHDFFGGLCTRGIYDNLKTVVTHIGRGKEREYNTRFLALASHYLFEPTACTPASGNEKGQVENQVGTLRTRLFTPRLRFQTLEELNAHLAEQCLIRARNTRHPEWEDKTIWEAFQEEVPFLRRQEKAFEGYVSIVRRAQSTCLVMYDSNFYSIPCEHAGKPVEIRAYARRIRIALEGTVIAAHHRLFGRGKYACSVEHYIPLLERKPGVLRNGRPFSEENLWPSFPALRDALKRFPDAEKQLSHILLAIPVHGLDAVRIASELMLSQGNANETTIVNAIARLTEPPLPPSVNVPERLKLTSPPTADCTRYDVLLEKRHVA